MRRQAGLLQFSTPVGQVRNFSIPAGRPHRGPALQAGT
ncbi:hypothetical protein I542_2051 [Mycobacteroides abscessus 1948]|uniref:Uncharacterized protein n=1 Tax=Mycobacteroides abscessus 1948 TaxID=1299323 RepID=A0A829QG64_9MYCO|nr:hypothetical protein I542_2051 [Mycobacteroides abscessus 1948]